MSQLLAVSLKAYLGYAQTLTWAHAVADLSLTHQTPGVELAVLPTLPAIPSVARILAGTPVAVGAQNLAAADSGNQTGEVTGAVLAELGCRYVEVGHAERRTHLGESDQVVAAKTATAWRHGLTPILCVGEADRVTPAEAVRECLRQVRDAVGSSGGTPLQPYVVAYEPFWAIGQPRPASDQHILSVVDGLREATDAVPVIYGGSAGPGLLTRLGTGVDGLFLGRFAHDPAALASVLREASRLVDSFQEVGS